MHAGCCSRYSLLLAGRASLARCSSIPVVGPAALSAIDQHLELAHFTVRSHPIRRAPRFILLGPSPQCEVTAIDVLITSGGEALSTRCSGCTRPAKPTS